MKKFWEGTILGYDSAHKNHIGKLQARNGVYAPYPHETRPTADCCRKKFFKI
jgi:hypothetical protein